MMISRVKIFYRHCVNFDANYFVHTIFIVISIERVRVVSAVYGHACNRCVFTVRRMNIYK